MRCFSVFKKKKNSTISPKHTARCAGVVLAPPETFRTSYKVILAQHLSPQTGSECLQSTFVYRIARAHLHCMLSLRSFHGGTDFPHMSLVQIVQSPLLSTQIKRRSPNETQMWNVSAQLDLRQLRLRGRLFPESHNIRKTISITPLWPESAKRSRLVWKEKHEHVFSVYFEKAAPTWGDEQKSPHGRIKMCKGNFSKMLSRWRRFKSSCLTNENSCRLPWSAGS